MKHNTFAVVMIVEGIFALISMGLLFSDVGALIYPISLAIFAAVLAPFCILLRKQADESKKRKLRLWMALLLLIPIVVAIVAVAILVIALMLYFA